MTEKRLWAAIAANIKERRAAFDPPLSQAGLAAKAGVHVNTVAFVESGRTENVRIDTLALLAKALECTVEDLLKLPSGASPIAPFVRDFLASPLANLAALTPEERRWLETAPPISWLGGKPDPAAIYFLVLARRSCRTTPSDT